MVECIIVTQGALAEELVHSAEVVTGETSQLQPLCFGWNESLDDCRLRLANLVSRYEDREVLLLTDLYGGTPHRLAAERWRSGFVEVVSGVNLPMVIYLSMHREVGLDELVETVIERGRQSVRSGEGVMTRSPLSDRN